MLINFINPEVKTINLTSSYNRGVRCTISCKTTCWFIGFMKSISERNSLCKRYYGSPSYLHSAWERSCCRTRTPLNCRNTNPRQLHANGQFSHQPAHILLPLHPPHTTPTPRNQILLLLSERKYIEYPHQSWICSVDGEGLASVCEYLSKKRERWWAFFGHIWSGLVLFISDIFRFLCLFSSQQASVCSLCDLIIPDTYI